MRVLAWMIAGGLCASWAPPALVTRGRPTPKVAISEWLHGDESVLQAETPRAIVFAASWCLPSARAARQLARVEKRHGADVTSIAILGEDVRGETRESASEFCARMLEGRADGAAMDAGWATRSAWVSGAGIQTLPAAFVTDADGVLVWAGNPIWPPGLFEDAVALTIAGKADGASIDAASERASERARRLTLVVQAASDAIALGRRDAALTNLEEAAEIDPEGAPTAVLRMFELLLEGGDEAGAYALVRRFLPGALNDDAEALNEISWAILTVEGLGVRDVQLALEAAERAVEVGRGLDPNHLDTLARAYWDSGDFDKAIETQTRAVNVVSDATERFTFEQTLQRYRIERLNAR